MSSTISWVCSDSCPLNWWCYLTISCTAGPFSFCLKSFPASRYFLVTQLFTSRGQTVGASASASVLPMSIQGCFPLGLTDLISLHPKELSSIFSKTTVWKHQPFGAQPSLWSNSHIYFCISLHIYPKHQEELLYQLSFQSSISFLKKKVIVLILLFLLEDSEWHLLVYNLNCPVKDSTFLPKDSMLPYLEESSYLLDCSWDSFSCPGLR